MENDKIIAPDKEKVKEAYSILMDTISSLGGMEPTLGKEYTTEQQLEFARKNKLFNAAHEVYACTLKSLCVDAGYKNP